MAGKHVDGVALLEEPVGNQGLSSRIRRVDVRVVEDVDELVHDVVGVVLRETARLRVVVSRLATLPLSPARCRDGGGGQSKRGDDAEELHLGDV